MGVGLVDECKGITALVKVAHQIPVPVLLLPCSWAFFLLLLLGLRQPRSKRGGTRMLYSAKVVL